MSIQILADFEKATVVELPAAFFASFPTPAAVEKELGMQQLENLKDFEPKTKRTPATPSKYRSAKQDPAPQRPSKQLFWIVAKALGLEANAFTPSTTFESLGMDSMLSIKTPGEFQEKSQTGTAGHLLQRASNSGGRTKGTGWTIGCAYKEPVSSKEIIGCCHPHSKDEEPLASAAEDRERSLSIRPDPGAFSVPRSAIIHDHRRLRNGRVVHPPACFT